MLLTTPMAHAATIVVNTVNDGGPTSLRVAISFAKAHPESTSAVARAALGRDVVRLRPSRPLPPIVADANWVDGVAPARFISDTNTATPVQLATTTERLMSADNVALDASVSASSGAEGQGPEAAIDGVADGFPGNTAKEWATAGEREGANLRMEWKTPQTIDHVQLFDRPNSDDNILAGVLSFSDGSTLNVGPVSSAGSLVRFPSKTVSWLSFKVTAVSPQTQNVGLSELAVFWAGSEAGTVYGADNIAGAAQVSASSSAPGQAPEAAVDGQVSGFPDEPGAEWSSGGEREGATLRLEWKEPQTIDRVQLFDRPNSDDDVTGGTLSFSDGSTIEVGALAKSGTEIRFTPKTVSWLSFKVTAVSPQTHNVGLAEIAVYRAATPAVAPPPPPAT